MMNLIRWKIVQNWYCELTFFENFIYLWPKSPSMKIFDNPPWWIKPTSVYFVLSNIFGLLSLTEHSIKTFKKIPFLIHRHILYYHRCLQYRYILQLILTGSQCPFDAAILPAISQFIKSAVLPRKRNRVDAC